MNDYVIAPSILSANFAALGHDVDMVIQAGADWIHFDVMDNHYVPNLTVGPMVCQALRDHGVSVPIDVHLMVQPVDDLAALFAQAGASHITFHPDASRHVHRTIQRIRDCGCQAGLAFNPGATLDALEYCLDDIDLVLIMSVNPGFAGQTFIPSALKKIRQASTRIQNSGRNIRLQVDGGVNLNNLSEIANAGADTFVAGSAVFHSANVTQTLQAMRQTLCAIKR